MSNPSPTLLVILVPIYHCVRGLLPVESTSQFVSHQFIFHEHSVLKCNLLFCKAEGSSKHSATFHL